MSLLWKGTLNTQQKWLRILGLALKQQTQKAYKVCTS